MGKWTATDAVPVPRDVVIDMFVIGADGGRRAAGAAGDVGTSFRRADPRNDNQLTMHFA